MLFDRMNRKIKKVVNAVNRYEEKYKQCSDGELRAETEKFKQRLQGGETLNDILPEAFALVREAASRTIGMRHYDVQVYGGYVLHNGDIAEMKTGEGKTLVATLPAYLNALEGKGVHVVTVNDYLARRDREWMGKIYEFLGLSVGLIQSEMGPAERKEAYGKDITYVTNNELGFDYLRDNMVRNRDHKVLREMHYAIIDEVDSILIDEARTPLIISGISEPSTDLYLKADAFAKSLEVGERIESELNRIGQVLYKEHATETGDVIVDRKEMRVYLTDEGIRKAEKFFGIENYGDIKNVTLTHHINQALRANYLHRKDIDYVVRDGKVEIVDEFTGRILKGRVYSDGLHQAIEAKEGVEIRPETKTLASITYQNLFRMYRKIAGMTGTAKTEEEEFRNLYNMEVKVVPTNKPVIRIDRDDRVFITQEEKYEAVIKDIEECYKIKRPVLVGTTNIEVSELISNMLKKQNIPHNVLNAKHHEREAEIIAQAGKIGSVTVATNMAGRGTDIVVDEEAKKLGGLKVIGTERHESRRIDNQLRGRTGRQGDPGESIFYLSLEDDLMKLFGAQNYMELFKSLQVEKGVPIKHPLITKAIRQAQKNIEANNYSIRRHVLEYDNILNKQRNIIYEDREKLFDKDMMEWVFELTKQFVEETAKRCSQNGNGVWEETAKHLQEEIKEMTGFDIPYDILSGLTEEEIAMEIFLRLKRKHSSKPEELVQEIFKNIAFSIVDAEWAEYLHTITQLQREIQLQAYGQKDPLLEYNMQSYELFNHLVSDIQMKFLRSVYHLEIKQASPERHE